MKSTTFDQLWLRQCAGLPASTRLESHVRLLYDALTRTPLVTISLHGALESLLLFLCSREGRTDANVHAVDYFLCCGDFEWPTLPTLYEDILADMAGALHDTISSPEIAMNFESTPEQLLERLRAAKSETGLT